MNDTKDSRLRGNDEWEHYKVFAFCITSLHYHDQLSKIMNPGSAGRNLCANKSHKIILPGATSRQYSKVNIPPDKWPRYDRESNAWSKNFKLLSACHLQCNFILRRDYDSSRNWSESTPEWWRRTLASIGCSSTCSTPWSSWTWRPPARRQRTRTGTTGRAVPGGFRHCRWPWNSQRLPWRRRLGWSRPQSTRCSGGRRSSWPACGRHALPSLAWTPGTQPNRCRCSFVSFSSSGLRARYFYWSAPGWRRHKMRWWDSLKSPSLFTYRGLRTENYTLFHQLILWMSACHINVQRWANKSIVPLSSYYNII